MAMLKLFALPKVVLIPTEIFTLIGNGHKLDIFSFASWLDVSGINSEHKKTSNVFL